MKRTIAISRPASGSGTVATITLVEDGVTVKYALRTFTTSIGAAIRTATRSAEDMLAQAKYEINNQPQREAS